MNLMWKQLATLLFPAVLCVPAALGQETETELDPVTVTASLAPEKVSRTGRNVFVIPGERISGLPVTSIDELLRYLPGIEVQMRGPAGAQSDIVLRGGTFQQVLVIIDGLRLNDANSGHFTSYIPITPSEIERVEVLKGASSAIYGSEAVGGVIHVITKAFAARQRNRQSSIKGQVGAGEYLLLTANLGGDISTARTLLSGGFLSANSQGQPQRGIRGYFYNQTASLSAGHHFNERWHLAARTSYDQRDFAAQNFYTTFTSDTSTEKVTTSWSQLQVTNTGKRHKRELDIGYKFLKDRFAFNSLSVANLNKSYLLQALLTDQWTISGRSSLVTGVQFINKRIRSNDRGRHSVDQLGLFAVWNQKSGSGFSASPGIRVEWNERSGIEFVPQVNLSQRLKKWQIRGSAGKTIRDADFTERFNNFGRELVTSGRIGNPALTAERSFTYEAGGDYFATGNFKLGTTFFQRFHRDLIDYVPTPYADMPRKDNLSPSGTYALARNISEVTTTGWEADLQYAKALANGKRLWSTIGLTWLETNSSSSTPSFYISSHARWLLNFNAAYSARRFTISLNGLYKSRQAQQSASPVIAKVSADYFVCNAKAEALFWSNKLGVFTQVDNVFGKDYVDLLGSQMPGRWFSGGVKFSFSK